MYVWIVLLSLVLPAQPAHEDAGVSVDDDPVRYRGIERLLAKFDAEATTVAAVAPKRGR
ncbi:MAG: hypothetical protein IAG13_20930 [Deltaproteobacteria bacterium]|nr:hypothetical protein [Nannocystaceae bacterium]